MTDVTFGARAMAHLEALAAISDDAGHLTRLYLSPAHIRSIGVVADWMRQAGMDVHVDAVGNVIGRYEGTAPGAPALLIGSHIDTVIDAGRFDGNLGVVAGIVTIAELHRANKRFPFAIEVVAFGDEEGVRFSGAMLGSRAFAGSANEAMLDAKDKMGTSVRDALSALDRAQTALTSAARRADGYLAYFETHIEQGPILESENLALGIVTSINGAGRYQVELRGVAGHAGTVPMQLRHDTLAGASEILLVIEQEARSMPDIVATVGQLEVVPGAINVIPGCTRFTLDIRGPDDAVRQSVTRQIFQRAATIAERRGLTLTYERSHEEPAVRCSPDLVQLLEASVEATGQVPRRLASGAGHDAMVIAKLCPIAMLFVRCKGGISHSPAESATEADIDRAIQAMLIFIDKFAAQHRP
jgi:hydantoinase/carbamoylase family amidase